MTGNKKEKTLYITHSGELLVWLIIVFIIVAVSSITFSKKIQEDNDYTIFMDDVDGLIVGSPVRMMGIEVGHITKIKPTNSEVYIKFVISDKEVSIPQGTVATVEFSGMAGSKSLELYLPDKTTYIDNSVPIITVNPPKRLHDAFGLLNEMFEKLGAIINTSSSFGKNINFNNVQSSNDQSADKLLQYADGMVEDAGLRLNKFNNELNKYKKEKINGSKK